MSARWKRNAVVGTMVVLVCAAAGLNWRFSSLEAVREAGSAAGNVESGQSRTKILGEAELVSGPGTDSTVTDGTVMDNGAGGTLAGESTETGVDAAANSGSAASGLATDAAAVYSGTDYFASARLTRQQARDNAISLLQEAARQEDADTEVRNGASEGIQVLASYTLKEAQIENLVTAKGYQDCVAFLGDSNVSVVVSTGTGELSAEDVARITDIATTETGLPASGVKILSAN